MNIGMIILRLLHILGGVLWAGTLFTMLLFVGPATRAAGRAGDQVNMALRQHTKMGVIMPLATVLTLLSGVAMYVRDSGWLSADWLATRSGMTLTIGAVAALVAFFGPGMVMVSTQRRLAAVGQEIAKAGREPAVHLGATLNVLQKRLQTVSMQLAVLLTIAVVCMATFRYM